MAVIDKRTVWGGLEVNENAVRLSNCFHAERQLLHCISGALPRVASLELKILLGTHLWDVGQNLIEFSRRLRELREHSDYPGRPSERSEELFDSLDRALSPAHQVAAIYRTFLPALCSAYDSYVRQCDPLLDEPTVRVLQAAQLRHRERLPAILQHLPNATGTETWLQVMGGMLDSMGAIHQLPLRLRQSRKWLPAAPLQRFERPASFRFGTDHGIEPRAIYGAPEEFYFPLDEEFRRHFLHHMVDAEIVAAELMACNIHEFPEMPVSFHTDMARQVWDEVRHAHVQWEMLHSMGVILGSYPVYHGYDLALYRRSLLDRLILFNRLGEAGAAQRHLRRSRLLRDNGLQAWANLFDYLHADEVQHVVNGSRWGLHLFKGSAGEFQAYCNCLEEEFRNGFSDEVVGVKK
jgi:hypothetical protein